MTLKTVKCDICGRDYTIDDEFFSPYGTEYVTVRLENFITSTASIKKYDTCPECTRKVLKFIGNLKGERNV